MKKEAVLERAGNRLAVVYKKPGTTEFYCVTFKREWYHNFSNHFPFVPDKGIGQIASLNLLEACRWKGVENLVAVMPDGVAYVCSVKEFLEYYYKWGTDVETTTGHEHLQGEVASPVRMWKRLYPAV